MSAKAELTLQSPESVKELLEFNQKNDWPDLDAQRKMFAVYYMEDYNHGNAAEKAQFSRSNGVRLMREPLVNAYILELQKVYQARGLINADFVRVQMLNLLPKMTGEEEVAMVDKDGGEFMAKKFHASESIRLMTELAKSTKFYEDGAPQGGNVQVNINLAALGIDEGVTIEGSNDG